MAVILALDTSTEACSCALSLDGVIDERFVVEPRQHARLILPMIHELLASHGQDFSGLDAIAFGRGPGSFTGLRIAAGITQGIAFAAELPVIPVSTLAALALEVYQTTNAPCVLSCLDARIDEIYWGVFRFENGLPVPAGEERLCKPEAMAADALAGDDDCAAGGNGLVYEERFPAALRQRLKTRLPALLPRAGHIATLAAALLAQDACITADAVRPVYLRDKVTHDPVR
jgi:tRNA threonylcarbamoyladenosine biosynthesis protein TsaB